MMKNTNRILYLIPNLIADVVPDAAIPRYVQDLIGQIKVFFAEDIRNARRFIKRVHPDASINELTFYSIGKHSEFIETSRYLTGMQDGSVAGILSEAGLPCIADPGSGLVALAHELGIKVVPLPGPSSIILALIASGFSGQNFSFHGYLPIPKKERTRSIREIENAAYRDQQTGIIMEAPYRNKQLLQDILETCNNETRLCIAANITATDEYIRTRSISGWKNKVPDLHKKPVIFCIAGINQQ